MAKSERTPDASIDPFDKVDLARWLNQFLGKYFIDFEGANARDLAIGIANQQASRWRRLLMMLEGHDWQTRNSVQQTLNTLRQTITSAIQDGGGITTTGNKTVLSSRLPLLIADPSEPRIAQGRNFPLLAALVIASKCKDILLDSENQKMIDWVLACTAIEASQAWDTRFDTISVELRDLVEATRKIVASQQDDLAKFTIATTKEIDKRRADIEEAIKKIDVTIDGLNDADKERASAWNNEKQATVSALRDEISEFTKIESSLSLWQSKADRHAVAFVCLSLVFASSLLAVIALVALGFATEFVDHLTKIPADHQFLGIALLAIPTLAFAWLLRFIARVALQNLSLGQDARLRHAQVSTYLRLLGDPKKPISENERILALAALFRPLSGQGPEDVNPPTIADLLKEATAKASK